MNIKTDQAKNAMKSGRARGLTAAAEHVLGVVQPTVPHEDGDLERTGVASVDAEAGRAAVSFKDADYGGQAKDQEQNETYRHDPGRKAHFLRDGFRSERATVAAIIGREVKTSFGGK